MDSLRGTREAPGRQERTNWTLPGTREAPGRQERANWAAWEAPGRHQGGRKRPFGQPGRHQGGTREVGKDHLDSLGGTREAPVAFKGNPALQPRRGLEPVGFGVLPFLGLIKCYICV